MNVCAVLYVPAGVERARSLRHALNYCQRRAYTVAAVVVDTGSGWASAFAMLAGGEASVLVVARRDQLPADRTPRVEVVAEQRQQVGMPAQRRPRRRSSRTLANHSRANDLRDRGLSNSGGRA